MSKYSATLFLHLVLSCLFPFASFAQSILQKMMDETKDGDTLYIEKNDYNSDNSITLTGRKDLTLIFEEGTTITCTSQFQDIFVIQHCTDIQIFNGTFKHLISEEANSFGSGIYLFQSQNIRIFNADIENNGIRGVFAQAVTGLELTKCNIHNNSASAFLFQESNRNIVLKGNQYENNGTGGDEIYAFNTIKPETDPFESIDERTLNVRETFRMDSIFRQQRQVFAQIRKALQNPTVLRAEYDSLNKRLLDPQQIETLVFPAWLEHTSTSGNHVVWLNLPENVCRYLCDASGLARFDTRDANEFFKYDEPDFTNISPKAFLKGIQSDAVYLNEIIPSNIHWICDPELELMVQELKNKSIQQIAEAQETVIYRLLQVWEKYQSANLLYEKLHLQLVGKCRFIRNEYAPEAEMLDAHLFLDDYYMATMRIPMKATQAKQFFYNREDFTVYFTMQVHPGFKQVIFSGIINTTSWTLPNPELLSDPSFESMNQLGIEYHFKAYGLLGQLWPDGFSRKNWENACPTPANRNYQYLLLGGLNSLQTNGSANGKILPGKNSPLYKSGEVINRIVHSMEYYSKSMGDCYFGLTNNAKRLMESILPAELKDRQFLVFTLETEAEAEIVKKALLSKGMHFTDSYSKGQLIFCYTRQLK